MEIKLCESVAEFLDSTENFRSTLPYETNIISSVAESVRLGNRTYDAYFWWVIRNASQEVTGAAMRTVPHGLILSPMDDSAVEALAVEIAKFDDELTGVGGRRDLVRKFLKAYRDTGSAGSQREIESAGGELLYVLEDLILPTAPGDMLTATSSDYELLHEWLLAFAEEAGIYMHDPHEAIEDGLNRKSLKFWTVDGEIVSLVGHAPVVQVPGGSIARIGPVYTPPSQRRRGYAGVLTAALSRELRDGGAKLMLYTDASNPTSNSVYQKIGYVKLVENERISFVKPS